MAQNNTVDLGYTSLVKGGVPCDGDGSANVIIKEVVVEATPTKVTMSGISTATFLSSQAPRKYAVTADVVEGRPQKPVNVKLYVSGVEVQSKNIEAGGKYTFNEISISKTSTVKVEVTDSASKKVSAQATVSFGEYCYDGIWTVRDNLNELTGQWVVSNWSGSNNRQLRTSSKMAAKTYNTEATNGHVVWVVPTKYSGQKDIPVAYVGSSTYPTTGYYKKQISINGMDYDVYVSAWQLKDCKFELK